MAASLVYIRVLLVCGLLSCAFLVLTAPGVGALKFLNPPTSPDIFLHGFLGMNVDINCSTDDPNATVTLLYTADYVNWIEKPLEPSKLILNGQVFTLLNLTVGDGGKYNCRATNGNQTIRWPQQYGTMLLSTVGTTARQKVDEPPLSTGALAGIGISVGAVVLVVLVICIVVYHRQKKQVDEYKKIYLLRQSDYQIDPDRSLLEQCNDLPYDPDWEFPEERLILGDVVGVGAFAKLVRAEAIGILALDPRDKSAESFKRRSKIRRSSRAKDLKKDDIGGGWKNVKVPVVLKTLKEGATEAEYKDLASELKILIHLGQHKNIINLLGACTRGKRLMVIMEFAPHGSLLSFLRGKRDIYEPDWTKTTNDPQKEFTLVDLVMIGYQVSRGMAFLASKKCIQKHVATCNVVVGEDYVMKVADVGVYKSEGHMPIKWMALESLFDRLYTEKSDIWSFGICLWEIFTLGGTPYPGIPTEQMLDFLSEGHRLKQPHNCPLDMYTIMRDCWEQNPEQRPTFARLSERIGRILELHACMTIE